MMVRRGVGYAFPARGRSAAISFVSFADHPAEDRYVPLEARGQKGLALMKAFS
jgi:hypothetical protein